MTPFLLSLPERQPDQIAVFLLKTGNLSISWGITVKDAFHVIGWNMDVFLLRYALKQGIFAGPFQKGALPQTPKEQTQSRRKPI